MSEMQSEPKLPSLIVDDDGRSMHVTRAAERRSNARFAAIVVVAIVVAAAFYWLRQREEPPVPVASPPAVAEAPAKSEPAIRHPIDETRSHAGLNTEEAKPLPTIDGSDAALRGGLAGIPGAMGFERLFHADDIVRRFVATVDNLPRSAVAARVMAAKPVPGAFVASTTDAKLTIANENSTRYTPYVRIAQAVDTKMLVALYVRFYPLFQQAYQELGYPSGYFNDRLIDVVDHLLAIPDVSAPIALVQPHVLYEFADPKLEALSAGQKIMLRMGPENAAQVKAKLRELRRMLTGVRSPT